MFRPCTRRRLQESSRRDVSATSRSMTGSSPSSRWTLTATGSRTNNPTHILRWFRSTQETAMTRAAGSASAEAIFPVATQGTPCPGSALRTLWPTRAGTDDRARRLHASRPHATASVTHARPEALQATCVSVTGAEGQPPAPVVSPRHVLLSAASPNLPLTRTLRRRGRTQPQNRGVSESGVLVNSLNPVANLPCPRVTRSYVLTFIPGPESVAEDRVDSGLGGEPVPRAIIPSSNWWMTSNLLGSCAPDQLDSQRRFTVDPTASTWPMTLPGSVRPHSPLGSIARLTSGSSIGPEGCPGQEVGPPRLDVQIRIAPTDLAAER